MADPFPTGVTEPCGPSLPRPPSDCELREATPDTVGPLAIPFNPQAFPWGNDCDVDVDPIGACAPPSGRTVERRVGPVHLTLLVCGGGLGQPVLA